MQYGGVLEKWRTRRRETLLFLIIFFFFALDTVLHSCYIQIYRQSIMPRIYGSLISLEITRSITSKRIGYRAPQGYMYRNHAVIPIADEVIRVFRPFSSRSTSHSSNNTNKRTQHLYIIYIYTCVCVYVVYRTKVVGLFQSFSSHSWLGFIFIFIIKSPWDARAHSFRVFLLFYCRRLKCVY